jgi:ABC-2 type transport system ATP-binding protein
LRAPRGDVLLPDLVRAIDAASIPLTSMSVTRPTLDDVFLTLTGRSLRDAEMGAEAVTEDDKEPVDVA